MDLSDATFLQVTIQLDVTVTMDKAILIQYSTNGGIFWNTLNTLYYYNVKRNADNPAVQYVYNIPSDMQTQSTRVRMWQPGSQPENDAIWRIDDFYIGGERVAPPLGVDGDFTSSLAPEMWPSYAGGVTGSSYCGRDSVILFSNSSSGLHHLTTTFLDLAGGDNLIQFEVNVHAAKFFSMPTFRYSNKAVTVQEQVASSLP